MAPERESLRPPQGRAPRRLDGDAEAQDRRLPHPYPRAIARPPDPARRPHLRHRPRSAGARDRRHEVPPDRHRRVRPEPRPTAPISPTFSTGAPPRPSARSTGCATDSATPRWSKVSPSPSRMRTTSRPPDRPGTCQRHLQGFVSRTSIASQLAADGKVVVVEQQRARDAVLVELELDRVDRQLVARLRRLVEIAHRDRPAHQAGRAPAGSPPRPWRTRSFGAIAPPITVSVL